MSIGHSHYGWGGGKSQIRKIQILNVKYPLQDVYLPVQQNMTFNLLMTIMVLRLNSQSQALSLYLPKPMILKFYSR